MMPRRSFLLAPAAAALSAAQEPTMALVGLRHSHTWNHLENMLKRTDVRLVGIAENIPELVAEARKMGATETPYFDDYTKMLDQLRPQIVWAFVENNRHLEVVEACAPRKIHVVFEKPLAATYAQALAIRELAEKHGIQVMTNFGPAWRPGYYAAKARAEAGDVGQVWRLRATTGHGGMNMGAASMVAWAA